VQSGVSAEVGAAERLRDGTDALVRWLSALPPLARAVVLGTLFVVVTMALRSLLLARKPAVAVRLRGLVGAAVLAVAMCGAAWVSARKAETLPTGAGSVLHAGSTLDATARGASGFYVLLGRLGVPVRRLAHPWPPPRGVRTLVVLSPEEPPSGDELAALQAWVERGGVLMLGLGSGPFGVTFGLDDAFGLGLREVEVYGRVRAKVAGLEVEVPAGRVLAGGDEALVASDRGPLCVRKHHGVGQVIACAGSYVMSNDGLLAADDAAFSARLIAGNGSVAFDEFHHGAGSRIDAAVLLAKSPIGWAMIQLGVALVMLAFARGNRPEAEAW
jgi:hypothetical protein